MKTIRQISGLLLLLDGVLHFVEFFNIYNNSAGIGTLVFGVIYVITGLLLFNKKTYPVYLGLIMPIIGITLSTMKYGIPELISLSAAFKLIGLMVICCCVYILVNQKKP